MSVKSLTELNLGLFGQSQYRRYRFPHILLYNPHIFFHTISSASAETNSFALKMESVISLASSAKTKHSTQCKTPKGDHDLNTSCCEKLNIYNVRCFHFRVKIRRMEAVDFSEMPQTARCHISDVRDIANKNH